MCYRLWKHFIVRRWSCRDVKLIDTMKSWFPLNFGGGIQGLFTDQLPKLAAGLSKCKAHKPKLQVRCCQYGIGFYANTQFHQLGKSNRTQYNLTNVTKKCTCQALWLGRSPKHLGKSASSKCHIKVSTISTSYGVDEHQHCMVRGVQNQARNAYFFHFLLVLTGTAPVWSWNCSVQSQNGLFRVGMSGFPAVSRQCAQQMGLQCLISKMHTNSGVLMACGRPPGFIGLWEWHLWIPGYSISVGITLIYYTE